MDLPYHLMRASFSPPIHAPGQVPGSWALLDNQAYFSDHENATTVECRTREDGQLIKVTFCLAKPPLVSHFCIRCPGMGPEKFGTEPSVLATEERFALLRVPICRPSRVMFQEHSDYFIYQASSLCRRSQKPPLLLLLPNPHPLEFADDAIGILPRDTHKGVIFVLAALQPRSEIGVYKLHLFSGEADNWTSRVVSCDPPLPQRYSFWCIDKVITIDTKRGLIGWVDLWRGTLICDVLSKNPVLQYVPLPTPVFPHVPGRGSPDIVRDMVVVRGTVRYFEMKPKIIVETRRTRGWIATTWSTRAEHSWKWHEECTFDVFDVVIDGNNGHV
jgi:hypothetical protein